MISYRCCWMPLTCSNSFSLSCRCLSLCCSCTCLCWMAISSCSCSKRLRISEFSRCLDLTLASLDYSLACTCLSKNCFCSSYFFFVSINDSICCFFAISRSTSISFAHGSFSRFYLYRNTIDWGVGRLTGWLSSTFTAGATSVCGFLFTMWGSESALV